MVCAAVEYTKNTLLFKIDNNLNTDRYISDILSAVVLFYFRGLRNAIFQKDHDRSHTARRILTFHDTQCIRLLY